MSKVSALVSAYFSEEWFERRINNLLEQTLTPEICLVLQAGSPEDKIYVDKFKHIEDIKLVRTPDIPTIYHAWNMAIRVSTGEYLTNANTDDILRKDSIEFLADFLDKNKLADVVYTPVMYQHPTTGQLTMREWYRLSKKEDAFSSVFRQGCFIGPMPMWRANLHEKFGMFDSKMRCAGDYEFWLRIASKGARFHYLDKPIGTFLHRPDSLGTGPVVQSSWEVARARARWDKNKFFANPYVRSD